MSGALSSAYDSLASLVQSFESGGNYTAQSQTTTASGAYQFTNPTWAQYYSQIGGNLSQYPTAASAPAAVQDSVFQQAVAQNGLGDWTCPGCDPGLSNYLATNPAAANLPTLSGSASTGSWLTNFFNPPGLGQISNDPTSQGETGVTPAAPAGTPTDGLSQAQAALASPGGVFQQFTGWLSSIASRAGLFILAVLFIIGAIALFGIKSGIDIESSPS